MGLTALAAAPPDPLALGLPLAVGALAIFLLLPQPQGRSTLLGGLLGVLALAMGGFFVLRPTGLSIETFLFYLFSAVSIASGALLVTQQNPARAALAFALVVLSTSGLYLILAAPFLMAASIVVYAGAIVVTFLFVLMLAQQQGLSNADARSREPLLATLTGFVLLGSLLYVLQAAYESGERARLADSLLAQIEKERADLGTGSATRLASLPDRLKAPLNTEIEDLDQREAELLRSGGGPDLRTIRARVEFARGLRERVETVLLDFPEGGEASAERVGETLDRLARTVSQARQQQGWLRPSPELPLSSMSGPPPNLAPDQYRTDDQGRPHLPGENTHYLGKALFTDFFLAVELAGMLLLVAAIGAIAIAHRRSPEARQS